MTTKAFWHNSKIAIFGGGSWGTVLSALMAKNCAEVRLYVRAEEQARAMNSTRSNPEYFPNLKLHENVRAFSDPARVFESPLQAVIWAVPSSATRDLARKVCHHFTGEEILLHATKGIEEGSLKRISVVLHEELPCPRIGVISGPNLAGEIGKGEPAATVVASPFQEVINAGIALLSGPRFQVYSSRDIVGVEWAGTLKNVLAIASGCLDSLGFGWNVRAMLLTRGLSEITKLGVTLGAEPETFSGLAGVGDLIATASSPLSRNFRIGARLARGEKLDAILEDLDQAAEGVRTVQIVTKFARENGLKLPICEAVHRLVQNECDGKGFLEIVMRSLS